MDNTFNSFDYHINAIGDIISSNVESNERYNLYPIKDEDSFEFYKKLEANNWSANEINCDMTDKDDYNNMSEKERKPLEEVLAFFSSADGIIVDNLAFRFILEAKTLEEKCFFIEQLKNELVHSETYSKILFHLISDENKRNDLLKRVKTNSVVGEMDSWIKKWIYSSEHKSLRFLAFACTEWLLFQGAFCIIFSYRKDGKGRLKNVMLANQFIARDECLHSEFGLMKFLQNIPKFSNLDEKNTFYEKVDQIINEALELAYKFGDHSYDMSVCGIDKNSFKKYIQFIADKMRIKINLKSVFNVENPFTWMELISMNEKSNFFEMKVSSYKNFSMKEEESTNISYDDIDF